MTTTEHPAQAHPRKAKKKFPVRNAILLVVAAAALGFGIPNMWYRHNHETTDDAQVEGHILPVMPRVGGYVEKVFVRDEQEVKAGDTLFTLDRRELEIRLRQAEADLLAAEAASKNGVAGAGVSVAETQKSAAQSNLDKARKDLDRVRELNRKDIASKSQLDAAEAAYQAASEQARSSVFSVAGANAQIRAADARLEVASAALDAANLQLSYTVVVAATAGHVAKKNLEPGQWVSAGQAVLSIVDDAPVWVVANLKETQLDKVRLGQSVEVDVDAFPGEVVRGEVESIQYATGSRFSLLPPDNASGNFTKVVQRVPVKIRLDNTARLPLRPGMSVSIAIDVHKAG
jgi:membrane fusion protein (multidrug efflux system)